VTRAKDSVRLARTDKLQNAINREEVNAAEANVRANEANLAYLRAQLDNTYVRSPIDGIVQKRATNPGEGVDSGKMLILVVDAARLYADIEVADTSLAFLPVGKTVEVNVDALPREKFQGVVREILPVADPQSRAFTVRIGLYNPDSRLKPGMFARVEVALSQKTRALIIPRDVIVERDQRKNVFVVDSRKIAQLRPVTTGILKEDKAEITGGLRSTDTIILKGQQYVKPGDVVTTAQ
jgi:membrane fusion protein (multidrug efflux system)